MKSALITGASSGFGKLTALELARLGWRVFAAMRDAGKAGSLQGAARDLSVTDRLHVIEMDVTKPASIQTAVARVIDLSGGTLDVVLNNAGYTSLGFFEDMTDEDCRSVMETNFFGAIATSRAVIPLMRSAGHGRIGFVTSNAVNAPHPTMTMYAASKWALEGFAEALAMELAPFGVDVVVLQPGNHRTPFGSNVRLVKPPSTAYADIWEDLAPGLTELGAIGAEVNTAISAFVRALVEPRPAFLQIIGNDAKLFSWLKRRSTYETRAAAVRHFVGFPGRKPRRHRERNQ